MLGGARDHSAVVLGRHMMSWVQHTESLILDIRKTVRERSTAKKFVVNSFSGLRTIEYVDIVRMTLRFHKSVTSSNSATNCVTMGKKFHFLGSAFPSIIKWENWTMWSHSGLIAIKEHHSRMIWYQPNYHGQLSWPWSWVDVFPPGPHGCLIIDSLQQPRSLNMGIQIVFF